MTQSANLSLKHNNVVNKQVTTSTQDRLELLESLSDCFRQKQASTSH